MNKRERMYEQIEQHGNNLLAMFPDAECQRPIDLCKKLLRLENAGHALAEAQCDADQCQYMDAEGWDRMEQQVLAKVNKLLHTDRVWFNSDPRGYALKVDLREGEYLFRDWGGNGIIAPDFVRETEIPRNTCYGN